MPTPYEVVKQWRADNPEKWKAQRERYRAKNAETVAAKHRRDVQAWRKGNPEKISAQRKVQYAVKTGKLKRGPCEACGVTPAQAHHDDYSKPLDVRWLCQKCHLLEHS